jgi:hypothetical protein
MPLHDQEEIAHWKEQVHLVKNPVLRWLLVAFGTIFLGLGILGIVLPILPTTPFLLLTAGCYAYGSEKFYIALMDNRWFGPYIRDWRDKKGIPMKTKLWVIGVLVVTMGISIIFFVDFTPAKYIMASIGAFITWYIWKQPTKRTEDTAVALEDD